MLAASSRMTGDSIHLSMQITSLDPVESTASTIVMAHTLVNLNAGRQCGRHLLTP